MDHTPKRSVKYSFSSYCFASVVESLHNGHGVSVTKGSALRFWLPLGTHRRPVMLLLRSARGTFFPQCITRVMIHPLNILQPRFSARLTSLVRWRLNIQTFIHILPITARHDHDQNNDAILAATRSRTSHLHN